MRTAIAATLVLWCATALAQNATDATVQWQAYWVWGVSDTHMSGGKGYFRLSFEVPGDVASAIVQGSGDDGYQLFVNNTLVRSSGFGFNRTDTTDVKSYLKPGKNILAAVCNNAAFPGGWLAQLQIVYADGREEFVLSNRNTKFASDEQPGWNGTDFDDDKWEACREISQPPQGAWGPLPLEYAGKRRALRLVSLTVPDRVRAGDKLMVRATVTPSGTIARDEVAFAALFMDGVPLGAVTFIPDPPTSRWAAGHEVAIGPFAIPVNRYVRSGQCEVKFGVGRCVFEGMGNVAVRNVAIEGREGRVRPTPARVVQMSGGPQLQVAGKPMLPVLYLQGTRPVSAEYSQMARAGYSLFSLPLAVGWVGPGKYNYADTDDAMLAALEGAPDGYFIPRVDVSAPSWWIDAHPTEAIGCADGTKYVEDGFGGTKHQSFASELWREEGGEALRRLIEHIQQSPYADRVIGYHVTSGIYGEWHLWSPTHLPDVSEPMRQRFIAWCRETYTDDLVRLNAAWGLQLASFDEITCATQEERFANDLGTFKDFGKSRRVPDYWRCLHETTASAIGHLCKTVKGATGGQALAGVFYGYLTDIGWEQEGGHLAAATAFADPNIDFFCSPHSYSHRAMGEDAAFRAYPASIRAHGKLFIDEGDDRTHLSGDKPYMHAKTLAQDIAIMQREALNAFTNGTGFWWFDMTTAWFNDPQLLETAAQLHAVGERTLAREPESYSEVAMVLDPTTYYALADWKTGQDPLQLELCSEQFRELQMLGAPYDVLLLDDALAPTAKQYKLYLFANTWHMTDAERLAIVERLQNRNRSLVFAYAPGFSGETSLDTAHMTQLTGMQFAMQTDGRTMQAIWMKGVAAIDGLKVGETWGLDKPMAPRFSITSEGIQTLADWADGGTAAALAQYKDWTALYCGTGRVPAALLAHTLRLAGGHIWTPAWREGSNLWAGNGLLGVHAAAGEARTFHLPWRATVRDALSGEVVLDDGDTFTAQLPKWETVIYELERK
ncbi:MAG: hypothetical protein ACYC3X_20640 [Pirellulaceae bacterium]